MLSENVVIEDVINLPFPSAKSSELSLDAMDVLYASQNCENKNFPLKMQIRSNLCNRRFSVN